MQTQIQHNTIKGQRKFNRYFKEFITHKYLLHTLLHESLKTKKVGLVIFYTYAALNFL